MPKTMNGSRKISKFVKKLIDILQDPKYSSFVAWLPESNGFQVSDPSRFIEQVLPNYFRHKNMASFVRQLNLYGFTRPKEFQQLVYSHPRFVKGNMNSIRQIQKKAEEENDESNKSVESKSMENFGQEQDENLAMSQLCMKLARENEELRSQNLQIAHKLYFLQEQQRMLENIPFQTVMLPQESTPKSLENYVILNNQETNTDKNIAQSFIFGSNFTDWNRIASYCALIRDANQNSIENDGNFNNF